MAHLGASLLALKRLKLDRVWWLVTPGNPLKNTRGLAPLGAAHRRRPRAHASSAHRRDRSRSRHQHAIHLRYDILVAARCPRVRLRLDHGRGQSAQFPPLAELARHREAGADRGGRPPRAQPLRCRQRRRPGAWPRPHPGTRRRHLPDRKPPAWAFLHGLKSPLSSTALRALRASGRAHRQFRPASSEPTKGEEQRVETNPSKPKSTAEHRKSHKSGKRGVWSCGDPARAGRVQRTERINL